MSEDQAKTTEVEDPEPVANPNTVAPPVQTRRATGININSMTNGPDTPPVPPSVGAPPPKRVLTSEGLIACHKCMTEQQELQAIKPDKNRALQIQYLQSSIKCGSFCPENK